MVKVKTDYPISMYLFILTFPKKINTEEFEVLVLEDLYQTINLRTLFLIQTLILMFHTYI